MCTAICRAPFFGRTLDYELSFGESIVFFPRKAPLPLRHSAPLKEHYATIGIAALQEDFPLFFDGMNEHGLWGAGLAFQGEACYFPPRTDGLNLASFEVIPYLLGSFRTLSELRASLPSLQITEEPFSSALPPSPLHWIFADESGSLVLESTKEGLQVYENPIGVLTNPPPFPHQLSHLRGYSHLSAKETEDPLFPLPPIGRGSGAIGLPGDLSSPSRFVRAAFCNALALRIEGEPGVCHFFRLLQSVSQPEGCNLLQNGAAVKTIYSACADTCRKRYYYATYESPQIIGVDLLKEPLDSSDIRSYPLLTPPILIQNPCQIPKDSI